MENVIYGCDQQSLEGKKITVDRGFLLATAFVVILLISLFFTLFKPCFGWQSKQLLESEPQLHMEAHGLLQTWYRDSYDRPVGHYFLYILISNSGNASGHFVYLNSTITRERYIIRNEIIPIGNVSKGDTINVTKIFELSEGHYEVDITLETPSRVWDRFTDTFQVDLPREGFGDYVRFYVTPKDPLVLNTVNIIGKDVDALYSWVADNIRYVNDSDAHGVREFWQLPYETLNLTGGDCEDQAFLLCSLIRASSVSADDIFVALGTVDGTGHAWVILKTIGGWRVLEPTAGGIIERFQVDIIEFFGLMDREYYSTSNDLYFEEINHSNNRPYVYQSFDGWYDGDQELQGSRATVEIYRNVTVKITITNHGYYAFIGFIKIEIRKDIVLGIDWTFASGKYAITLYPAEAQQLQLTFTPDEVTENAFWKCRQYYYKVYSCFASIHDPIDADTRECLFVIPRFLETDLNRDGTVNIMDVSMIARAFGTKAGEKNWNVIADLDKNGVINIIDVSMVARDYGKTA